MKKLIYLFLIISLISCTKDTDNKVEHSAYELGWLNGFEFAIQYMQTYDKLPNKKDYEYELKKDMERFVKDLESVSER